MISLITFNTTPSAPFFRRSVFSAFFALPAGCSFNPRCPYVMDVCLTEVPALIPSDGHHAAACHLSLAEKERIAQQEVLANR